MKKTTRQSKSKKTETKVPEKRAIQLPVAPYQQTRYGRSALTALSKFQIAEIIVRSTPGQGYAEIIDLIRVRKGRVHALRMQHASETRVAMIEALVKLPREILVDISYAASDLRLNSRYKGVPHATVKDDNHGEQIEKSGYALKDPRFLEIPKELTTWEKEWKKRKKRGFTVKFKRAKAKAPAPKRAANDVSEVKIGRKVKPTVNWVAALRQHNAYLGHEAKFTPRDTKGRVIKDNKPKVSTVTPKQYN